MSNEITPFEQIRRTNPAGHEFWSSRDFARVLGYADYRNFEAVIERARTACFNSGQRLEDHFVGITDMIGIGKGGQRPVPTVMMSRYACYLVIQNADPAKAIVALGQTYFALQTRRQELSDEEIEGQRRLAIRSELRMHNSQLADAAKDAGVVEPRDYAIGYQVALSPTAQRDLRDIIRYISMDSPERAIGGPKARTHASPGQRPGLQRNIGSALKGRPIRPPMSRPFRAGNIFPANPGRCPGLACLGPLALPTDTSFSPP